MWLWHLLFLLAGVEHNYSMPTASMQPTLRIGDVFPMAVTRPYGIGPQIWLPKLERGDIVIFFNPPTGEIYAKRVIGIPGDTVGLRQGRLYINQVLTPREFVTETNDTDSQGETIRVGRYVETLPGGFRHEINEISDVGQLDDVPDVLVPAGQLFVLGDNRDRSADSRVRSMIGLVSLAKVIAVSQREDDLFFWYRRP